MSGRQRVWIVTGDEGHLGTFSTEELAEQHAAGMDGAEVEWDIVRDEPMFREDGLLNVTQESPASERWAALGDRLANEHSQHQADLLGAYALASGRYAMQFPLVAERLLLAEKDDPDMRATREAVQRFCRDLLKHLDEGSR